jgi:hypothetical protein
VLALTDFPGGGGIDDFGRLPKAEMTLSLVLKRHPLLRKPNNAVQEHAINKPATPKKVLTLAEVF